jgi:hypothetical protein
LFSINPSFSLPGFTQVFLEDRELSCPYDQGPPVSTVNYTYAAVDAVPGLQGFTCASGFVRFQLAVTTGPSVQPMTVGTVIDIIANLTAAPRDVFNTTTATVRT